MNHIIFNVRTALDRAIDEPELLTEDDRGYLKLLRTSVFNITTAGQKLLGVYQDKNNPDDSVRYMAGLSPTSAPYTGADARDTVVNELSAALSVLGMTELSRNIVSTYTKESLVTDGYVVEGYDQKKKRESRKGGNASAKAKKKLLDEIEKLAIVSCKLIKEQKPSQRLTLEALAISINDDVIRYIMNDSALASIHKITSEEKQYSHTCSRVDVIKRHLSTLKKQGRLAPWLIAKKV